LDVVARTGGQPTGVAERPTVDRTTLHRVWRGVLVVITLAVATACYFVPALLVVFGALLLVLLGARVVYRERDRFIPNLYARDTKVYDESYRAFIRRTMSELRQRKIGGHTLLWEAAQLEPPRHDRDELLLDLGVWLGWSTRLASDASGRKVYGFDTFEGLVEDWQVDDQMVVKSGTFSLTEPIAQRLMPDTGVKLDADGVPGALGRDVEFIKGMTYDTLVPFLAAHPDAPIRIFHMDLDTYESCLHGLETCKEHFVEGSILVFDEYLVTNAEMQAFYEFQQKYELDWHYRSWGLEMWEMNIEMVTARWKRVAYYFLAIAMYWTVGNGNFAWAFFGKRFWRFWGGAPLGDIAFMLGASGQRKSVSLEITGLGKLDPTRRGAEHSG
jgi:Macrocin-O-methyltransferase (TylF)